MVTLPSPMQVSFFFCIRISVLGYLFLYLEGFISNRQDALMKKEAGEESLLFMQHPLEKMVFRLVSNAVLLLKKGTEAGGY